MQIITEVLRELRRGVTPRELALRFGISVWTVRNYYCGRSKGRAHGRPRALSLTQERVCFACWSRCEATLYELASIYRVTPQTIRNVLKRHMAAEQQTSFWWRG